MVDVLNTPEWSPRQALLKALDSCEDMAYCAIVYVMKDGDVPHMTLSTMSPADMNFCGFALQTYSVDTMKE